MNTTAKPNLKKTPSLKDWVNNDNIFFYDNIPLDLLPGFAIKGGLDTGCELDLIQSYIVNAKNILEVGAGYGRIIENLIKRNYTGKIVAIERSLQFCKLLNSKYSNIEIIHGDIKKTSISYKFDLILWLWSGICDFVKNEQLPILKIVLSYLKPNGHLVLDSMPPSIKPVNAGETTDQYSLISAGNCDLRVYTPSVDEIKYYANKLGLGPVEIIPYKTTTQRDRILYVLSRKID